MITLGPKGRNVVLGKKPAHRSLPRWRDHCKRDRAEGRVREHGRTAGAKVAIKTNDAAGDGTTTATVLAQAMVNEGMKKCYCRCQPHGYPPRMSKVVTTAVETIVAYSQKVKIKATISPASAPSLPVDPEIGRLIAEAREGHF